MSSEDFIAFSQNPPTTKDTKVHKGNSSLHTDDFLCVPSCPLWLLLLTFSLLLRRNCQPKNRNLPRPRHIQTTRLFRIRQIKCLAMFAAIDFGIASPSLLHISASLLEHIGCVKPAFEMPTAKLAFLILLVASPLSRLLDFDLVLGELRRSLCPRGYACRQKVHPSSSGSCRRQIELRTSHSTRSLLPDARSPERP